MLKKLILAVFLLLILAAGALAGGWWWINSAMNTPHEHAKANEYISIPKGSTPAAVIGKLVSEGVISNGTPVLFYLRTLGDGSKIKAGDYKFPSPISPMQVLTEL